MKGERQHTDFNEYDDTPVTCPRCGSTQIHTEKIAYGQFLSNKILISCLKCGHQFRLKKQPIPDRLSVHPLERTLCDVSQLWKAFWYGVLCMSKMWP